MVVVGSGGAGLAAAIQAHDEGANVLIVEKMPTIGGNTIKASAGMNAAETRFQRVKGIQDSKELFYQESLKGGGNKNDPELLRRFVENAPQAIEWLADARHYAERHYHHRRDEHRPYAPSERRFRSGRVSDQRPGA